MQKTIWLLALVLALPAVVLKAAPDTAISTVMPSNPPEMKPIANRDTPADRAAKWFRHGVNLGDYLESSPQSFGKGVTVTADEFAIMHREGFDHVRVPVGWQHYVGPGPAYRLSPLILGRVDFVVTNALANHLAVIINIHHFDELDQDPAGTTEEFLAIWQHIAMHYRKFSDHLAFELDNEPHDHATTAVMNPIYARAIAEIRRTNPGRTLFVEPGRWGSIDELKNLVLPPDDNVIVSVHCYDPFHFTHQGTSWTGPDFRQTGIQFPGPPAKPLVPDPDLDLKPWVLDWIHQYNTLPTAKNPSSPLAFADKLKFLRVWSDYYGYPVHIGEFGAYVKADPKSRANFYAAFRRLAEKENLGWCIWDWSANFRYWDKKTGQPMPGMRAALFGK